MAIKKSTKKKPSSPSLRGITTRDQKFSESYDEYLECIYRLALVKKGGWVKNKEISVQLNVKAPSVTNMLEKLSKSELIDWKPRSGIRLTEPGRERARELVCNHLTIELFLRKTLKFRDDTQIHKIACDFEHHMSPELTASFRELLGINKAANLVENYIRNKGATDDIEVQQVFSESQMGDVLNGLQKELENNFTQPEQHQIIEDIFEKSKIRMELTND